MKLIQAQTEYSLMLLGHELKSILTCCNLALDNNVEARCTVECIKKDIENILKTEVSIQD